MLEIDGLLEDDDFFAEAIRSISELEESSTVNCSRQNAIKSNSPTKNREKLSDMSPIAVDTANVSLSSKISGKYYKIETSPNNKTAIDCITDSKLADCEKGVIDNQRFTPGFTPKSKKRKFPGPAGIDEYNEAITYNNKSIDERVSIEEIDYPVVPSSQLSVDELLQSLTWQKLQEDVSSNPPFLSTARNYSIQRVLNDTAKRKLPKHIIVPLLCVYIKKFNSEEPITTYMDDTGEINGKIEKDTYENFKSYVKTGTSLILTNVPFMCNVMLIKDSNIVSFYLEDGAVHHIQDWKDVLKNSESLKATNTVCPITPKPKGSTNSSRNLIKTPMQAKNQNNTNLVYSITPKLKGSTNSIENLIKPPIQAINNNITNQSVAQSSKLSLPSVIGKECVNNNKSTKIPNDLDLEDHMKDDFDELLGNLDEKSFLEEF